MDKNMPMLKIIILIILSFSFMLKAENLERIAVFPFKTSGIDTNSSLHFVELLKKAINKSKQYKIMKHSIMITILSYNGYRLDRGEHFCYDDECAYVMGEFLSVNKVVQGYLKKLQQSWFSMDLKREV